MLTFPRFLKQAYQTNPNQTIITLLQAKQEDHPISYRALIEGAAGYAATYQKEGIQPGEVIVLILQHGEDLIYAFWGAVLHGAIPSIMPFLTEKLLPERYRADLAALIEVTQPSAIVTYPEFESEVRMALNEGDSVRTVIISDQAEASQPPDFDVLSGMQRQPEDIVLLQHSSGTTGLQKGVALSHQAVFNQLENLSQALDLRQTDVIVSWLPLYHDMGLIAGFLMPVLTGLHLVLMSPFEWVRAPYRLMQAVSQYQGTLSWLPNFAYHFCAQKIRDRHLEGVDLSSLRAVINCSEPVRDDAHAAFYEKFAPYGFRKDALAVSYAMAENVFAVTQAGVLDELIVEEIDREALQVERLARPAEAGKPSIRMVSCGLPIPNVQIKIVNPAGETLPARQVGEVAVSSNCKLTEYYHRPDVTALAFLDQDWYLTGDFGYMVDGHLYITGRKKDLIIVGGKNVYPQDLEKLAMEIDGVHAGRVSAFGIFDEEKGTEDVIIVAEVDTPDPEIRNRIMTDIRNHVNRGSAVALRQVYLVEPGWMVKTSSGKTARLANREKYLQEISV
jgi:acyl-CoA synthetase (AMP-forming)/AMP-acid ligase II